MGASLYLGSISEGGAQAIGATVVIALFIHKIPESIAFGSYLIHQNCNKIFYSFNLLAYALASPISAVLTLLILEVLNKEGAAGQVDSYTSIAMLVSVGTFLYVVTIHILPEVYLSHHRHGFEHFDDVCKDQLEEEGFLKCEGTINKACQEVRLSTQKSCKSQNTNN